MTQSREARILQIAAVAVAAPRYMGAFASALGIMIVDYYTWFPHLEIWSGAAMALIEGWAIAFVFRRLRGVPGRVLPLLLVALMLALPAVAAPYLVSSQLNQPVEQIVPRSVLWLWSLLVAAIAPLVLAAVGYAESAPLDAGTVSEESDIDSGVSQQESEEILHSEPAKEPEGLAQERIECEVCGREFGSQQALNAHKRFCALPVGNGRG